jgi:hypothetical protein
MACDDQSPNHLARLARRKSRSNHRSSSRELAENIARLIVAFLPVNASTLCKNRQC